MSAVMSGGETMANGASMSTWRFGGGFNNDRTVPSPVIEANPCNKVFRMILQKLIDLRFAVITTDIQHVEELEGDLPRLGAFSDVVFSGFIGVGLRSVIARIALPHFSIP